jgi:hypothetical protein
METGLILTGSNPEPERGLTLQEQAVEASTVE